MLCRLKEHHGLCLVLQLLLSVLAGHVVWTYLRMPLHGCFSFLLGVGIFFLFRNAVRVPCWLRVFSLFLAAAVVLAYHIVFNGNAAAPATQNYITDYSFFDLAAFGILAVVAEQALAQGLQRLRIFAERVVCRHKQLQGDAAYASLWDRLMRCPLWVYAGIMVLCWSPWLLVWYPGFIYGDSINSVMQALGKWSINNHFPVLYTMWVKLWLVIGIKLHSVNVGCFLYSASQMLLMAFALSYSARWMYRHSMHPVFCLLTMAWFALTPFFAQNNISMWKDPLFSAILLLLALKFYDVCLGQTALRGRTVVALIFLSLGLCFSRNNGAWLLLFCGMGFVILAVCQRRCAEKKRVYGLLSSVALSISIVSLVIQGPVFTSLHWNPSFAETVAVPLNQMVRVVCCKGTMSERNREFMNHLLPLDKCQEAYAPCLIDKYKWFPGFNADYLGKHKKEFFRNYLSMLVRNPKLAFEGWQLLTAGFWSPTHCTFFNGNVPCGNLKSLELLKKHGHGIWQRNLLENRFIDTRFLFSELDASFPLGAVFWLTLLIGILALKKGALPTFAALLPVFALDATLFLASPLFYWPRYGYAVILLLPVMLFLLLQLLQDKGEARAA